MSIPFWSERTELIVAYRIQPNQKDYVKMIDLSGVFQIKDSYKVNKEQKDQCSMNYNQFNIKVIPFGTACSKQYLH